MTTPRMPRIQDVAIPILRAALPGATVGSWVADVDIRQLPVINVRRIGGLAVDVRRLDRPTIELTAYGGTGLVETEDLYQDARAALWDAVQNQTVTEYGNLHSFFELMGPTQFDSPYDGTWRIQGLIRLGLRPLRS
jgi:hypothetical protein